MKRDYDGVIKYTNSYIKCGTLKVGEGGGAARGGRSQGQPQVPKPKTKQKSR